MTRAEYDPDWIPPPGETASNLLARKGFARPQDELSSRFGALNAEKLLLGELLLDAAIANLLSDVVGLSKSFWLERERRYREALVQRQLERALLAELPVDEMRARAFIRPLRSHDETIHEIVSFFGEAGPNDCRDRIERLPKDIKQKASQSIVSSRGSLAVWVRAGELKAADIQCAAWNRAELNSRIGELRALTRIEDPVKFLPDLSRICADCGIALVILRKFVGCAARGAVKFLSPDKAMILLSARHLANDQFWFSFFHEVAHLLSDSFSGAVVDDGEDSPGRTEAETDEHAADILIPGTERGNLALLRTDRDIIAFARRIGISRGVVVGQMQRRGLVGFEAFNRLKVYYQWNDRDELQRR